MSENHNTPGTTPGPPPGTRPVGATQTPQASDSDTSGASGGGLQGYFDWQITTLMLAYDLVEPIRADQPDLAHDRREQVIQEVRDLSLAQVPGACLDNDQLDWPPQVIRDITRATLARTAAIIAPTIPS